MGSRLLVEIGTIMGSGVGSRLLGLISGEFETKRIGPKMEGSVLAVMLAVDKTLGEIGAGPKMELD